MKYKKLEVSEEETLNLDFIGNWFKESEKRRQKAASQEYIDWLYNYVSTNKQLDDEDALYSKDPDIAENGALLSYFFAHVKEIAIQQDVSVTSDDACMFYNEEVNIKIHDKYFNLFMMCGQGARTFIALLDEEPDGAYVKLQETL